MNSRVYIEKQLVEQPVIGLPPELGGTTVSAEILAATRADAGAVTLRHSRAVVIV